MSNTIPNEENDSRLHKAALDENEQIAERIARLNGGVPINVQSPKQVSMAVFGRSQTATKSVLQKAAAFDSPLPLEKRQLATLILASRQQLQQAKKQQQPAKLQDSITTTKTTASSSENISQSSSSSASLNRQTLQPSRPNRVSMEKQTPAKPATHEQIVNSLFATSDASNNNHKIDPYWKDPLLKLSRPTARALVSQLDALHGCPMGYNQNAVVGQQQQQQPAQPRVTPSTAKKGTFLAYCRAQKELYPHCVVLVRCGDFYETYGLDAIMLVEHVGLNPMAGKCKAGCPYRNIQATVDGLTQQGLSVAVYEEVGFAPSNGKSAASKLKTRVLAQIVSPASPTYLYDSNWLLGDQYQEQQHVLDGLPPSRPYVGIAHTSAGYNLVELSMEEQSISYSERLTPEALTCRLTAYPPADPVVYIPSPGEQADNSNKQSSLSFWKSAPLSGGSSPNNNNIVESTLGGFRFRTKVLPPHLIPAPKPGISDADRYIEAIVDTFLKLNEQQQPPRNDDDKVGGGKQQPQERGLTVDDFTISMKTTTTTTRQGTTNTNPLYVETATQLGLLQDPHIPSLIRHVLDDAAPAVTRRFLHRQLMVPPPPPVAQSMATVVRFLLDNPCSLPPLTVPPLGKVLSLIRAGQASASIYGELLQSLATTREILLQGGEDDNPSNGDLYLYKELVDALLILCEYESGLAATKESLLERCNEAMRAIESVVSPTYHVNGDFSAVTIMEDVVTADPYIPSAYLERNEAPWRGRVQPHVAKQAYRRVAEAAERLGQAVLEDFIIDEDSNNQSRIVQDIFNNIFALKQIPEGSKHAENYYFHPRDRHGKLLKNRYTSAKVQEALGNYVSACDDAKEQVSAVLSQLAETLQDNGHIPALVQSAHLNLVLSAAFHHAVKVTQKGWNMAEVIEPDDDDDDEILSAHFAGVWPYWMDRSQAVSNTFDLDGLFLLTAPNMSGKSTLMRSTAAAALLTSCGLCAPVGEGSSIPRFDTLFLRGASADVPAENKSAFGAEMGDIAALMRCCGSRSLVFVDELGRGTSPRDGTRLAAAVLETMAKRGMKGIFATHLHDILELPLERKDRIKTKRMAIEKSRDDDSYEWTYHLEDGICTDSLALVTASKFGLPDEIIRRAEELSAFLPEPISVAANKPNGEVLSDELSKLEESSHLADQVSSPRVVNHQGKENVDFQSAIALLEKVTGEHSVTIPPRWSPPASFEKKSCVYVLELALNPPRYYVGETDSLNQRLRQHRRKGSQWAQARAAALPVESKTQARAWESLCIQEMAQSGFNLESAADGRSMRRFQTP